MARWIDSPVIEWTDDGCNISGKVEAESVEEAEDFIKASVWYAAGTAGIPLERIRTIRINGVGK